MIAVRAAAAVVGLLWMATGCSSPDDDLLEPVGDDVVDIVIPPADSELAEATSKEFADFMFEASSREPGDCIGTYTVHRFDHTTRFAEGMLDNECPSGRRDRYLVVWAPIADDDWTGIDSRGGKYPRCTELHDAGVPVEFYADSLAQGRCWQQSDVVDYAG